MVPITASIRMALRKFIADCGSQVDAERISGIANTTFSKWMSSENARMQNSTWHAVLPYIEKYLTKDAQAAQNLNTSIRQDKITPQEKALLRMFRKLDVMEQAEFLLDLRGRCESENVKRSNNAAWKESVK